MTINLEEYLASRKARINQFLAHFLPSKAHEPKRLHDAMHYAALNGGKRIRPLLLYAAGETFGAPLETLDTVACAVEFIHCYSLVHDDLPAMDNDNIRRDQPTCHKAFDEATAILVGDALLNLSFQVLASSKQYDHKTQIQMLATLAEANDSNGLIGGQALEIELATQKLTIEQLERIHNHKTGALIQASVKLGAFTAGTSHQQLATLDTYAKSLGLAFQIQDDIFDTHEITENKASYVSLFGIDGAKKRLQELQHLMHDTLNSLNIDSSLLKAFTEHIMLREF